MCTFVAHESFGPRVHPVPALLSGCTAARSCLQVLDASTVAAEDTFTYALVMDEAEPPLVGFNNGVAATRLYLG